MTMRAFTPAYLQREFTAPALLESNDVGTSYSSMNEWLHMPSGPRAARPVFGHMGNWTQRPEEDEVKRPEDEEEKVTELPQPDGPEDNYKRVYDNLTNQIAYRYPNPGSPRAREGCIGGTWRHIKEVLGHGGSRVVFVDGLVSVYDNAKFTEKLQAQLPYRPHIKPLYAPMKDGAQPAMTPRGSLSAYPVLPRVPNQASLYRDPNVERKLQLQERFQTQRRGFYGYK